MCRKVAVYIDRIVKGASPADLPVEEPTKFNLIVNARAAKALGIKIPQELRLRADKVIE
jgi:putative ABC transport system substrate-binding protein